MKKRMIAFILCIVVCTSLLVSCGNVHDPAVIGEISSDIVVVCGEQSVVPYEIRISEKRYKNGGIVSIESSVDFKSCIQNNDIPSIIYNDEILLQYGNNGHFERIHVHDAQGENSKLMETLDDLKSIPAGEWYIVIDMKWDGIDAQFYRWENFWLHKVTYEQYKHCWHLFKLIITE